MYVIICNSRRDLWNKADRNFIHVNASIQCHDDRCSKHYLNSLLMFVTHTAASSGVRRLSLNLSSLYERFYNKRPRKWLKRVVAGANLGRRTLRMSWMRIFVVPSEHWTNGITVPYVAYRWVLPDPFKLCVIRGLNFRMSIFWRRWGRRKTIHV